MEIVWESPNTADIESIGIYRYMPTRFTFLLGRAVNPETTEDYGE